MLTVPQGIIVVQKEAPGDDPATDVDESANAVPEYFVLRDRPELSGDQISNPKQSLDPTSNQPNVTFDFTDEGQQAFQEVTRRIAQRGAAKAPPTTCSQPRRRRVLGALRDRPRQRDRLAADHRLQREPGRHRRPHRRPDLRQLHPDRGPGPRQVPADRRPAGGPEADQPEHRLGDPRPGGARPGPQGGADRARLGPALPDRLLPLPRHRRRPRAVSTRSSSSR